MNLELGAQLREKYSEEEAGTSFVIDFVIELH